MVPHGETLETTFRYALPGGVVKETEAGWRYELDIQKQAGTLANHLRVAIHLPSDCQLLEAKPTPSRMTDEGNLIFNLSLQTDQKIEVLFK